MQENSVTIVCNNDETFVFITGGEIITMEDDEKATHLVVNFIDGKNIPGKPNEHCHVVTAEVSTLLFTYFNASSWQECSIFE